MFLSFDKEQGIINGISAEIEIDNTATGLVTAPRWSFKLPEKEAFRFSKEKELVYDPENNYWTFGGKNPFIHFYHCTLVPNQEAMSDHKDYLAESYDLLA